MHKGRHCMGKCDSQFSTNEVTLDRHLIPYSGKFLLGANFHNFCRQTCFRKNKTAKKIYQDGNWWHHYVYTSIRTSTCEQDGSLQSVCPLNSCCKEESACYYTKYQQIHKRRSEVVDIEISSVKSNTLVSRPRGTLDTFVIAKPPRKRKIRPLLHKLASSLRHSVSFLRFTYGAWLSTGRGVARASRIRVNKNREISSKESGRFSVKICTSENFPLYGSLDLSLVLFLSSKFSSTQWNVVLISVQDYATTTVFHRACSVLVATTLDLQTTTQLSTMQNVERHNGRCFHFVFLQ